MKTSVRKAIFWSIVGTTLVILIGINVVSYLNLRQSILIDVTSDLMNDTHWLAETSQALVAHGQPSADLDQLVDDFSLRQGRRATIILSDGSVLSESRSEPSLMENHANRPEFLQAIQGEEGLAIRYSETLKSRFVYTAYPIQQEGSVIGVARLSIPYSIIQSRINTSFGMLFLSSLIALLLVIYFGRLVSFRLVKPLTHLAGVILPHDPKPGGTLPVGAPEEVDMIFRAHREAMRSLQEQHTTLSEDRTTLSSILRQMNDGIIISDRLGRVQLINDMAIRLFVPNQADIAGLSLTQVVRNHQIVDLARRCLDTGQAQNATIEIAPGKMHLQVMAVVLENEPSGRVLMVIHDLTRLRHLELVRQDFVTNVSHELRTPLASLKALTETLQEGALEDPAVSRRFLQRMDVEIDNLTQMVRELLELSRIESGRFPLEKRPTAMHQLAEGAITRLQLQAERSNLQLTNDVPLDLPIVHADPERMEQVLVNLIHNAIKFTPAGGSISVCAYQEPMKVIITVSDTGVGIAPENLPRVFERFYKADKSRSGGGTGLGLSICRHLVEAHNGRIWVESEPGKGSRFFISLPR